MMIQKLPRSLITWLATRILSSRFSNSCLLDKLFVNSGFYCSFQEIFIQHHVWVRGTLITIHWLMMKSLRGSLWKEWLLQLILKSHFRTSLLRNDVSNQFLLITGFDMKTETVQGNGHFKFPIVFYHHDDPKLGTNEYPDYQLTPVLGISDLDYEIVFFHFISVSWLYFSFQQLDFVWLRSCTPT